MPNISKEDYLRVIFKNNVEGKPVTATLIAKELGVSNAAVTDMIKKLFKEKLVIYTPYKGVQLCEKGRVEAIRLVRRHRIWETFLYKVVGLPWYQIDEEAENLEHSASDELIDRLEKFLGYPEFDPHGHPIPKRNGKIPKQKKVIELSQLNLNQYGIVRRVNDHSKDLLYHLFVIGIEIGTKIKVLEKRTFDNSMVISIRNKRNTISEKLSKNVFVEKVKR